MIVVRRIVAKSMSMMRIIVAEDKEHRLRRAVL
jgi:hypothetical protein